MIPRQLYCRRLHSHSKLATLSIHSYTTNCHKLNFEIKTESEYHGMGHGNTLQAHGDTYIIVGVELPKDMTAALLSISSNNGVHPMITSFSLQGVIEFSIAVFFNKLVSFTFFFWLPLYVKASCESGYQTTDTVVYKHMHTSSIDVIVQVE